MRPFGKWLTGRKAEGKDQRSDMMQVPLKSCSVSGNTTGMTVAEGDGGVQKTRSSAAGGEIPFSMPRSIEHGDYDRSGENAVIQDRLRFMLNLLTGSPMNTIKRYWTLRTEGITQTVTPGDETLTVSIRTEAGSIMKTRVAYSEIVDMRMDQEGALGCIRIMLSTFGMFICLTYDPKMQNMEDEEPEEKPIPIENKEPEPEPVEKDCRSCWWNPGNGTRPVQYVKDTIYIYTDGSYKDGTGMWAFVVMQNGEMLYKNNGRMATENSTRAEAKAIQQAIRYAIKNYNSPEGCPIVFRSDCQSLVNKVNNARKDKKYLTACLRNDSTHSIYDLSAQLERPHRLEWVRGHNGEHWNEMADHLAAVQ